MLGINFVNVRFSFKSCQGSSLLPLDGGVRQFYKRKGNDERYVVCLFCAENQVPKSCSILEILTITCQALRELTLTLGKEEVIYRSTSGVVRTRTLPNSVIPLQK